MVAPISERNQVGLKRAEIKQGLRQLIMCKDSRGLVGMRIKSVSKVNSQLFILKLAFNI